MTQTINENTTMTADTTEYTVKTPCVLRIGATSGTVTVQISMNAGVNFFNTDTTIANGTMKIIEYAQQGDIIKVIGGNAILNAFKANL